MSATAPDRRSRGLILLTFLAAASAALQVVDAKLHREQTQNREMAAHLFEQVSAARAIFNKPGTSAEIAQKVIEDLRKVVFDDELQR